MKYIKAFESKSNEISIDLIKDAFLSSDYKIYYNYIEMNNWERDGDCVITDNDIEITIEYLSGDDGGDEYINLNDVPDGLSSKSVILVIDLKSYDLTNISNHLLRITELLKRIDSNIKSSHIELLNGRLKLEISID